MKIKKISKKYVLVGFIFLSLGFTKAFSSGGEQGPLTSYSKDKEALAKSFCFTFQASMNCDLLNMRQDTESLFEKDFGISPRNDARYKKFCMEGFYQAVDNKKKGSCEVAWTKYGCKGSLIPKLIQQNPFTVKEPILCQYARLNTGSEVQRFEKSL